MSKAFEYLELVQKLLKQVETEEKENIEKAIDAVANTMKNGGYLYTFGTGHSAILCCEPFFRAGGITACYPIIEDKWFPFGLNRTNKDRYIEREEGIMDYIKTEYPLSSKDTIIIYNYGGRNSTSVDVALICKEIGMTTIDVTSLAHASQVTPLHSSGKMVNDVCDIVIDNHGPIGDAAIDFGGYTVGPISTAIGAAITQAIVCGAVEKLQSEGIEPEVFISANVPGGAEHNEKYIQRYSTKIKWM